MYMCSLPVGVVNVFNYIHVHVHVHVHHYHISLFPIEFNVRVLCEGGGGQRNLYGPHRPIL